MNFIEIVKNDTYHAPEGKLSSLSFIKVKLLATPQSFSQFLVNTKHTLKEKDFKAYITFPEEEQQCSE